ncbi:hypothetical protein Btru_072420 [Bulinus truncatus]|nr:hypothetical protein Btru_072420 [Bulinus truncatus]
MSRWYTAWVTRQEVYGRGDHRSKRKAFLGFTSDEMVKLRNDLLSNYSVGVLPLKDQSKSIAVNMSFFLIMIHNLEWCDEFLQWSPADYGGIDELILFQKDVWLPDIFVENTAQHYRELGNSQMLISVRNTGMVHWEPGIITETSCAVNIGKYPFDTQVCDIRFLTWMHTNKTLTVEPEVDTINLDALLPNGEWDITRTEAKDYRYPSTYRAGTDHTGVTFVVHLRRKRFFYVLNTIIPVVMLSCLNVLVFILPSDCGERMALAVTVLLAFTVYLGIISDNIPKTSESLSLLAIYLASLTPISHVAPLFMYLPAIYLTSLLALSTASVVCAGIVLNIHYRDPAHPVPSILMWMFSSVNAKKAKVTCNVTCQRASISHLERRPVFWDQRRPSIRVTRRLTLREHRNSRESHMTDTADDKDDSTVEIEKPFGVTQKSNQAPRHFVSRSPRSPSNNEAEVCSETPNNNLKAEVNDVTWDSGSRYFNRSSKETHPNYSHGIKKNSPYEDNSPVVDRGPSSNNYRASFAPPESYELSRHARQASGQSQAHEGYSYLTRDSQEGLRPSPEEQQKQKADGELSWHEIGNSLDRWLFWIFFLVTNTVTVVILVLFIRNDTELDLSV